MIRNIVLLVALSINVSGCSLFVEPHDLTAGPADKISLLNKRVQAFHRALYWGSLSEASGYIVPVDRMRIQSVYSKRRRSETLVDLEVQEVEMKEDLAEVTVMVRYYRKPQYTVITRYDKEIWEFSRFGGGWSMTEMNELNDAERSAFVGD